MDDCEIDLMNECGKNLNSYFHFAPILLAPGSVIEPGNFGRVIRLTGAAHPLYRREMAYEAFRQERFPDRPSRLECLFCFPTLQEAELCRVHIQGYAGSILYEVESVEASPHIADMNNAIQNFALPAFDTNIVAYYWRGWQRVPSRIVLEFDGAPSGFMMLSDQAARSMV